MKGRRIAAIFLCIVVCIFLQAGCSNEEKEIRIILKTPPLTISNGGASEIKETYDLMARAGEDFEKQYDKNVNIEVIKFNYEDETRHIADCFDTEDATDILFEGYFNMSSYIYTGRPVPLDGVLDEDVVKDFAENDYNAGKVEGRSYMLPYYSLQNTLVYNKQMFKQCGLDEYIAPDNEVANWTLEEWDIILDTLAEKLPDMQYPMAMYAKDNQGDTHIMTLLRSRGCEFFDENNDFHVNCPEGIAALKWIQEGVDRNWYPEGVHNLSINDCMTLFYNNQLAICIANNASYSGYDRDKVGLVNFPSVDGNGLSTSFETGFMVFDNGDEEKLEVARDFLRYFYSQEEYLDFEAVGLPANKSVTEKMKDKIYMLDTYDANKVTNVDFTMNNPNWQGTETSVRSVFWPHIHDLLTGDITPEKCAEDIDRDCNRAIKTGREEGKLHK